MGLTHQRITSWRRAFWGLAILAGLGVGCDSQDMVSDDQGIPIPSFECGDGVVLDDEECDDGNTESGDGCSATCQFEGCGDGFVDFAAGEECDDGGREDDDGCAADCTLEPECGNGRLEEGEGCDDGNLDPLDGCSQDCTIESLCGNLTLDEGEECDDGNRFDDDGCSSTCMLEPFCGDGVVDDDENCDDGNTDPGDGCDEDCDIEPNTCGDGVLEPWAEECDDGNTDDLDGCSATCQAEATCDSALDIFATDPVEAGVYRWTGSNEGARDNGSGACESRLGGLDRVFLLDPEVPGVVAISVAEGFSGTAILHARTTCGDLSTQTACSSGNSITLSVTPESPTFLFVDAPVSDRISAVGDLEVTFTFTPQVREGEVCEPGNPQLRCASPLLCADDGAGGFTCQRDVDIGCGVGIPVFDVAVVDGVASFDGDTVGGVNVVGGSCASSNPGGPQQIFRVEVPFNANANLSSSASFDHIAFALTDCLDASSELACSDPGRFGLTDLTAGDDLYLVFDAWSSGQGTFSGEIVFTEILAEGADCSGAGACIDGTVCAPAGMTRTCQRDVDIGCGLNIPVIDLELDADGIATFGGNTVGGSNVVDGSCSSSFSGRPGGPQRIYRVTPPGPGNLSVSSSASFDHIAYALTECTDDDTELACSDPGSFALEGVTGGEDIFIVIDAWSTSSGSFSGTVRFQELLDLGDPCSAADLCPDGSVCAPAMGGGSTCQSDVDLGCGLNVQVIDVPIDGTTFTGSFAGDTAGGSSVLDGSCGFLSGNTERIYSIVPPFDGTMTIDSSASFDHILYVSTDCTEESEIACSDPGDVDVVVFAGDPVFVAIDAWFAGGGSFDADISFERALAVGDPCSLGDACPSGTVCDDDGTGTDVCRLTVCGDGVLEGTEECDDGNLSDADRCSSMCELTPVCGDGVLDAPEECDDGNTMDGDGCSMACEVVLDCGDMTAVGDEECDDGNADATDGCDECVLISQGEGGADCAGAVELRLVRFDASTDVAFADGTTIGAGMDLTGGCGLSVGANDRVFSFTTTAPRDISIELDPSSGFDGAVYLRGSGGMMCTAPMGEIDCQDGFGAGTAEELEVPAVPAGTYYIVVDGSGTSSGAYELRVTLEDSP